MPLHIVRAAYYRGHGYVVRLTRNRNGQLVRMVGTARIGGNVLGTRERGEITSLNLRVDNYYRTDIA